ncbi:hypothetical protein, partial [Rhodoplanes elegans]|uniref:hypothetical protein n=1 Tax=Rhodoplanes elegans TaxID=29408 RepID=UPI001AECBFCA
MIRFATVSAAAAVVLAAFASQPASARTPYDGAWSVVIITDRGTCDRAYRYSVQIVDGIVRYAGEMGMDFRGRVGKGGAGNDVLAGDAGDDVLGGHDGDDVL